MSFVLWMLALVALMGASNVEGCIEEERLALLDLNSYFKSHVNPNYAQYFHELGEREEDKYNCCSWARVQCNPITQHIVELDLGVLLSSLQDPWIFNVSMLLPFGELIRLDLSANSVIGLVDKDGSTRLSTLKKLQYLDLSYNRLEKGRFFFNALTSLKYLSLEWCRLNEFTFQLQAIQNLRQLQVLDLSNNLLGNFIFQGLANMRQLRVLDLHYNQLLNSSLHEIENLGELQVLDLSSNDFDISILKSLTNMRQLKVLDLSDNNLSNGSVQDFCEFKNLEELRLRGNGFHGVVPSCLNNLSSLHVLDLSNNHFNGRFRDLPLSQFISLRLLLLSNNNLTGELFPNIFPNLTFLQELDLSDNHLEGRISFSSFANLSMLQFLDLSRNQIIVETEDSLWRPTFQLQHLGLQGCNLNQSNGSIFEFLSQQDNLDYINLSDNDLVGSFPSSLLRHSLSTLIISGNNFLGHLPEDIGFLSPHLMHFNVSRCHFEGPIPISITNMTNLEVLDLSLNNFSGELPTRLLSDCTEMYIFKLNDNNLEGEIITDHMNLPRLWLFKANNNRFGGIIKDTLRISSNLHFLDISYNKVTGSLPSWIGYFPLRALYVSKNMMEGNISTEICKLQYLRYLDLSQNNFSGLIPSCSNLSSLAFMFLNHNRFMGAIPGSLSGCSSLTTLDLTDNQLSGGIPLWINKLLRLQVLLVGRNNLQGQVPYELCHLQDIGVLDLSYNRLSGGILPCFSNMSFGFTTITSYFTGVESDTGYDLTDVVVAEVVELLVKNRYLYYIGGVLELMSGLDLSSNKFSGVIPPELGNLSRIHSVNLSHNCLSGSIPSSFSNLKQIESLDLSNNILSGTIPNELVELNFLEIFNVSYNNLTGKVPGTAQFANFDERNYFGNPGLCGDMLNKPCNRVPTNTVNPPASNAFEEDEHDGVLNVQDFLWSFGMTSFVAFMATIVVLSINAQWREAFFDYVEWHLLWWWF